MLLHETATATALGAEGLGCGLLVWGFLCFYFRQLGISEGFIRELLLQTGSCKLAPPFMRLL